MKILTMESLRVAKSVNGQTTNFLYEYDKVVLELDDNGNQTARNVYGTNLLMRNDGTNEYYYMYNGHSDVTALLKQDGTLATTYYYDAFGNIIEQGLVNNQNYNQNFDGSTLDGWTTYGGTWTLANGNYSVASNPGAKSVLNNTNLADFVYEADIKITGTGGNAGIIFRVSSPTVGSELYYGYYAGIDISSQCVVLGKSTNYWTQLAASSMSIVSGQAYHVKVVAKGSSITVYVNDMDTPKITVNDSSYTSGSIGVRTYNANVAFDNVSVSFSVLVPADANNTINYAGYQYDKETGLYYCNARMYDPKTARFLSEDTYRGDPNDPLSLNLYTYCHNEPIMYTDPSGHMEIVGDDGAGNKVTYNHYTKNVNYNGKSESVGEYDKKVKQGTFGKSASKNSSKKTSKTETTQGTSKNDPTIVDSYIDSFTGFYKDQWESLKPVLSDPGGSYANYMVKEGWKYYVPGLGLYKGAQNLISLPIDNLKNVRSMYSTLATGDLNKIASWWGDYHADALEQVALYAATEGALKIAGGIAAKGTVKTWTSPDKYVGETATAIEAQYPGKVVNVNQIKYRPDGTILTDFDIELNNTVIQVKAGTAKGLTTQITKTAVGTSKEVIGYAPDLNPSSALVKNANKQGIKVFTSLEDLLNNLNK